MIGPGDAASGDRAPIDPADTPYARKWRLYYDCRNEHSKFLEVIEERFRHAEAHPVEFYQRAVAIVKYLQRTHEALHSMPGREFFRDPAEQFVGDLIFVLREQLDERVKKGMVPPS